MQQNDSVPSETMNVVATNVTSTASSTIAIANVAPNQPRHVTTTHTSTNITWQVLHLPKYIKRGRGWGKGSGGSQSSEGKELIRVT
jgi:hypothetical protein